MRFLLGNRLFHAVFVALFICVTLASSVRTARADDPDPWWGQDKALHFSFSAALASGAYAVTATQTRSRPVPLLVGASFALALGSGKELVDLTGAGTPSWKDFAWDAMGTAVGLALAFGIDLLVRGTPVWSVRQ